MISLAGAYSSPQNFPTASFNVYVPNLRFDIQSVSLEQSDYVVLCSDGIWNAFEQDEFNKLVGNKTLDEINGLFKE